LDFFFSDHARVDSESPSQMTVLGISMINID